MSMTRAEAQTTESGQIAEGVDILALVGVLWRAKWWIIVCGILAVLGAAFYGIRIAERLYPAQVTVALTGESQQVIADIESVFAGGGTDTVAINTELEVLRSRLLIGRLVDELNLVDDPEFSGIGEPLGIVASVRRLLTSWEPVVPEGEQLRNRVIDAMVARIAVSNVRQSLAFNIYIQTTDPQKSAEIVNRLADIYIQNQIRRKLDETTRAISFLSDRTVELQANVVRLEQDQAQRMEASDVIDASLLQARNLQLRDLRERVDEARIRVAEDQTLVTSLEGAAGDVDALVALAEAFGDSRFVGIVQRYRTGRLSANAAGVALEDVIDSITTDIRRNEAQLETLQLSATELALQIAEESDELIQMQQLEREVDAARLLYQTFLTRLQEASVQRGLETADASVLSEAVPRGASSPRVIMMMGIAAVFGGLLGAVIGLVREWRFTGFRTVDDLRQWAGRPTLGSLPAMANRDRRAVLQFLKEKPNSVFAEAVRNLRTSILMANPDTDPQVILVTSSIPSEGKTTLSIALARYFGSLEGRRVLLVEADIRRQTLRAYVSEEKRGGVQLIDVVLGRAKLDGVDLMDDDLGVEVLMGSGGDFRRCRSL